MAVILLASAFVLLKRSIDGIDPMTRNVGAGIVGCVIAGIIALVQRRRVERRANLVQRFGEAIAERILSHEIWLGQTEEQLLEALGLPVDTGERRTTNRLVRVFKYNPVARGKYGLKITLENGVVTAWDEK